MTLEVFLCKPLPTDVYSAHLDNNLAPLAHKAGLYEALWRPHEICIAKAEHLAIHLKVGLKRLQESPETGKDHDELVRFVEAYLEACRENPGANVGVTRGQQGAYP